ncbi:MAG TPA: hypothetical protein PLR18_00170 [bacterium]|nr:hypothetical protein [bacterium]
MKKEGLKFFIFVSALALILTAAVLVLTKDGEQGSRLWRYVPEGTTVFLELDLTESKLKNYLIENEKAKEALENFLMDQGLPAEIWDAGVQIQRVAWFVAPTGEAKKAEGWVIQGKNDIGQLSAFLKNFYFKFIDDKVAVIASSKDVLAQAMKDSNFNNLEVQMTNQSQDNFAYGFWKADDFFKEPEWNDIFKEIFDQDEGGLFYGQARVDNDGRVVFSLKTPLRLRDKVTDSLIEAGGQKKYFSKAVTFNVGGLKNFWQQILRVSGEDGASFEAVENYLNDKYKIEAKELYTIFELPFNLVVRPREKIESIDNLWQWNKNDYAVVTEIDEGAKRESVVRNWETLLINYLAFKFPERREKILPDKTRGEEIVVAPEKFKLESEAVLGGEIRSVKVGDFELGYALADKMLVIFNSADLAKKIITESAEQKDNSNEKIKSQGVGDTEILPLSYFLFADWFGWTVRADNNYLAIDGFLAD